MERFRGMGPGLRRGDVATDTSRLRLRLHSTSDPHPTITRRISRGAHPHSRGATSPGWCGRRRPREHRGRREDRVPARHPRPPRKKDCASARRQQVSAASRQPSLRSGFTVSSVLFPVNQLLPPSPARDLWSLARTWRVHGRARTTRLLPYAARPVVFGPPTSTAFHPNVRDDRDTSLDMRDGTKREHKVRPAASQG